MAENQRTKGIHRVPHCYRHPASPESHIKKLNRIDEQRQRKHQPILQPQRHISYLTNLETCILKNPDHVVKRDDLPGGLALGRKQLILSDLAEPEIRNAVAYRHHIVVRDQKQAALAQTVFALDKKLECIVELHDTADRKNKVKLRAWKNREGSACIHCRKVTWRQCLGHPHIAPPKDSFGEEKSQRGNQSPVSARNVEHRLSIGVIS